MIICSWQGFEAFRDDISQLDQKAFGVSGWDLVTWKGLFENRDLIMVVHEIAGKTAGFAVAANTLDEGELLRICVDPEFRQRGIGTCLLQCLIEQLVDRGVGRLYLEVREDNKAAVRLYRSMGFKNTGRRVGYYSQPVCDAVLYSLNLRQ